MSRLASALLKLVLSLLLLIAILELIFHTDWNRYGSHMACMDNAATVGHTSVTAREVANVSGTTAPAETIHYELAMGVARNYVDLTSNFNVTRHNSSILSRRMSEEEYDTLFRLCERIVLMLDVNQIPYMMSYGTLLGSYMMHDLLPWDDDMDFLIHADFRSAVIELFTKQKNNFGIVGTVHDHHPSKMLKVYFNTSSNPRKRVWKWPFIDIAWFNITKNNTFRALDSKTRELPWADFYPPHLRPLGRLWLPAPKNPIVLLEKNYKSFHCTTGGWDHKSETTVKSMKTDCSKLLGVYPFVRRTPINRITLETVVLNGTDLYSVYVGEEYRYSKRFRAPT